MQFDENAPVVKPHRLESCQTAEETWAEASHRQGPEGQTELLWHRYLLIVHS